MTEFLDHFGLGSRRDLPGIDELRAAGLLDPVDEALEDAMSASAQPDEEPDCEAEDDEETSSDFD